MAKKTDEKKKDVEPMATRILIPDEYMKMSGKTICVIHMFSVALQLALKNTVLYVSDDPEKIAFFQKYVINNAAFGNDDRLLCVKDKSGWQSEKLYDNMENFLKMNKKKKFDCCIMNPPYGDKGMGSLTLHFDITLRAAKCANETVSLFPSKIINEPSSRLDKYKIAFDEHINVIREMHSDCFVGTAMQDIAMYQLSTKKQPTIEIFRVNGTHETVHSLLELSPFTKYENKFIDKLKKYTSKL